MHTFQPNPPLRMLLTAHNTAILSVSVCAHTLALRVLCRFLSCLGVFGVCVLVCSCFGVLVCERVLVCVGVCGCLC